MKKQLLFFILLLSLLTNSYSTAVDPWTATIGVDEHNCGPFLGATPRAAIEAAFVCAAAAYDTDEPQAAPWTFKIVSCDPPQYNLSTTSGANCYYIWGNSEGWFHLDGTTVPSQFPISAGQCGTLQHYYPGGCYCYIDIFHHRSKDQTCPAKNPAFSDPIYPLTGSRRQDIDFGMTIGGIPLVATYDSVENVGAIGGVRTWVTAPPPSFGATWDSSLHKQLQYFGDPNGYYRTVSITGAGDKQTAAAAGSETCGSGTASFSETTYSGTVNRNLQVNFSNSANQYFVTDGQAKRVDIYAGESTIDRLISSTSIDGKTLAYTYTLNLLTQVTDQFGRSIAFTYEQPDTTFDPRVKTVTAPDGAVVTLAYDANDNLISLQWPDGYIKSLLYERSDLPWALTGVMDEATASGDPQRAATYTYDVNGLVQTSSLGTNLETHSVSYASPPQWNIQESLVLNSSFVCRDHSWQPATGATVTLPSMQTNSLGATVADGMTGLASRAQPGGSGCSASASNMAYDTHENVVSRDDFNGGRTCYGYDLTRDIRIQAIEGLPVSKACPTNLGSYVPSAVDASHPERKTTTVWHPDWVLKTQEAEPKKITTWVYNGQTDPISSGVASCSPAAPLPNGKPVAVLCARYEQATTDATGALGVTAAVTGPARKWSYTYNSFGQILTETTPSQSATDTLSHTTTYTYCATTSFSGSAGCTLGDLQTITNPLGQITTFTSYDKAGRLLSSTDPNGTVTTQTYFPRGWLQAQTVTPAAGTALTTTYAYWPTGLLQTVTLPDSSTLSYSYDAAHRLTDVIDGAGNKMHYVLDNTGNRTGEQLSDASGNLASSISRVFDALNRVQTTTGLTH